MFNRIKLALILLFMPLAAFAQSTPGFIFGQVPSASQWNSYFAAKLDYSVGGIPLSVGGTGAITASSARTSLGVGIGTNVQAWDASLDSFSALTGSANAIPYFTGASSMGLATVSQPLTIPGALVPNQTIGITGTTTNNNAQAGAVGEYITASLASGSALSLTSPNAITVTSISLTAGDWDVTCVADFTTASSTSVTSMTYGISTTAATIGSSDTYGQWATAANVIGAAQNSFRCPDVRISTASTLPVYLVTKSTFTASTMTTFGTIRARRIR